MVSDATIHEDVFDVIFDLLVANKPTYTAKDGSTKTYSIRSTFPEANDNLPCIEIHPAKIPGRIHGLGRNMRDQTPSVRLDFYAPFVDSKNAIDSAKSSVKNLLFTNFSSLASNNLVIDSKDSLSDDDEDTDVLGTGAKVHYGSFTVNFVKVN